MPASSGKIKFTTPGGATPGIGIWNVDFERKSIEELNTTTNAYEKRYYYPRKELGDYNSIVTQMGTNSASQIVNYIKNCRK